MVRLVNPDGFNLLSLDGGGIKGICSAMVLQAITDKVNELNKAKPPTAANGDNHDAPSPPSSPTDTQVDTTPADLFDLAAGTSTGAIIAVMLFRLGFTADMAVKSYKTFGEAVFAPRIGKLELKSIGPLGKWIFNGYLWAKALFTGERHASDQALRVIDDLVKQSAYAEDKEELGGSRLVFAEDKQDAGSRPHMLMCATKLDGAETVTFRNYVPRDAALPEYRDITIRDALCASTAAPLYLPRLSINVSPGETDTFWDGGLLNNNPVYQVWAARLDLVAPLGVADTQSAVPNVKTVVSIGCARSRVPAPPPTSALGVAGRVISFATNTWARHIDFLRDVRRENLRRVPRERTHYFRFESENVVPGDVDPETVDIDDYKEVDRLAAMAGHWIAQPKVQDKIRCCAMYLLNRDVPARECLCDSCETPGIEPQVFQQVGKLGKPAAAKNGHN